MIVSEVKYASDERKSVNAVIDGETWAIPVDNSNRHYQVVLAWVEAGNSIEAAD